VEYYTGLIKNLKEREIFVFGSNPEGRHGAGAAKIAKDNYGAIYSKGRGIQGQSYGLVTKNLKPGYVEKSTGIMYPISGVKSVLEYQIINNIKELYDYAISHPKNKFFIAYTNNGYNLNGYTSAELFEMFYIACEGKFPNNIIFNDSFKSIYEKLNKKSNKNNFIVLIANIDSNPKIQNKLNYIYCGTGSALENPFIVIDESDEERDRICEEYIDYLNTNLKDEDKRQQLNNIWKIGKEQGEVILGCICFPKRCHCDTIKDIIDNKQLELNNK